MYSLVILALIPLLIALPTKGDLQGRLGNFDPADAKEIVVYAFTSYCVADEVLDWSCFWCDRSVPLEDVMILNNDTSDIRGLIGVSPQKERIYIAFRGSRSQSVVNWLENSEIWLSELIPNTNIQVHTGFLKAYRSIREQLFEALSKILGMYPDYEILITGHSLGGALAELAAQDVVDLSARVSVVTFGAPRVGNPDYSAYWQKKIQNSVRLVHEKDIVPRLPTVIFGYQHVASEVWDHDGEYQQCDPENGEDPTCSTSIPLYRVNLTDHFTYMGVYQRAGRQFGCWNGTNHPAPSF